MNKKSLLSKKQLRKLISAIMAVAVLFTGLGLENLAQTVEAATSYTTIYLVDDTAGHWIGNDNAVIEMVDNTCGHNRYIMTKAGGTKWSVRVPAGTYNVTFNRLSPDRATQWNSWSAGGRDGHNTYHATVPEHGYWGGTAVPEEGFHTGDIVYLDFYEYRDWKNTGAQFYVNFADASKEDNGGKDIDLKEADKKIFAPACLTNEVEDDVFAYTVTEGEEGAAELRFWRQHHQIHFHIRG